MKEKNWWWGRSTSVDIHDCDHALIADPKYIEKFVHALVKKLKMKRVGPTEIKRFGHGNLRGFSMMQFIETSTIVAHFDEFGNRAFIDIFSCKKYDAKLVTHFSQKFFKAGRTTMYVEERK